MPKPGAKTTIIGRLTALLLGTAAVVGACATLISGVSTLHDAWCNSIGVFCAKRTTVASDSVSVESDGTTDNRSDVCKEHQTDACLKPSRSGRKLVIGTAKFDVAERSAGVFIDGNPTNADPIGTSNIGWLIDKSRNGPEQICAVVYARTSACETKVFLKGQLKGDEE